MLKSPPLYGRIVVNIDATVYTLFRITWPGGHTGVVTVDTEQDTINEVIHIEDLSILGGERGSIILIMF